MLTITMVRLRLVTFFLLFLTSTSFAPSIVIRSIPLRMSQHPFCDLPGDPSLILTTNIDLGDKKLEIMKAISKAMAEHTGKPEAYIAVSINDKADVIFAGSDAPTALGCMYSIGAIAKESNGKITAAVADLLEEVDPARIYINFFDMPRENVGWSKRTFAG